jgi:hypothetical protein
VASREPEIAVRLLLGASARILGWTSFHALRLAMAGVAVGAVGGWFAARLLRVFGIRHSGTRSEKLPRKVRAEPEKVAGVWAEKRRSGGPARHLGPAWSSTEPLHPRRARDKGTQISGEVVDPGLVISSKGHATFKLTSVESVAGSRIAIRATPAHGGRSDHLIELPGNKNPELLAPAGTEYMSYIDNEQTVTIKH